LGETHLLHAAIELIVFSVIDLTSSIERLSKDPQATGASANVHMCRLRLTNIDVDVGQAVSRYQSLLVSNYAVVGALQLHSSQQKEIRSTNDADMLKVINVGSHLHSFTSTHHCFVSDYSEKSSFG